MEREIKPQRPGPGAAEGKNKPDSNEKTYNPKPPEKLAVVLSTPLEARWAKFFDLLNVPWVLGWPLPFWLPFDGSSLGDYPRGFPTQKGLWVAVGEFSPSDEMRQRCRDVAARSGHWTHFLVGNPQPGFEVWSWRVSERINVDGRCEVSDFEKCWNPPWVGGSIFDVDFFVHTVPGTSSDVCAAFQTMQWEAR